LSQQSVLALGKLVGQFLHDVGDLTQFEEFHLVSVHAEDAMDAWEIPVGQSLLDGQLRHVGMLRWSGDVKSHPEV